jgi:hypothetical protein
MDEFISTTDPLPVSNCMNEVLLWVPLMNHSLMFNSVSAILPLTQFPLLHRKKKVPKFVEYFREKK